MEYDVVFPSIFVNSLILGFIEDGSSCATHSCAFFRDWSFLSSVCSSVSSSPSACAKKNCSSSATSEEDVVTSMFVVCTSSLILSWIFSVTFISNCERKSGVVFTEPTICAFLMLNCSTKSHAFHKDGGTTFVWKNSVTELLSVRMIVGFVASYKMCANKRNAM